MKIADAIYGGTEENTLIEPSAITDATGTEIVTLTLVDANKTSEAIIANTTINTPSVRALISGIDLDNPDTLTKYGYEPAKAISASSDKILAEVEKNKLESATSMIKSLTNLMQKFEPKDFTNPITDQKGLFGKIKATIEQQLQKLLDRYTSFGGELSKIVASIEQFKIQRNQSNALLRDLYHENWRYYQQLQEHVFAGGVCLKHIDDNIIAPMVQRENAGQLEHEEQMRLKEYQRGRDIFERQIHNLTVSAAVALGSMPTTQSMIYNNIALLQKYDATFITTIPAFKNGIIQFITMKQQQHEAAAMEMLDNETNKLLERNAVMAADAMRKITGLAERSGIKPETLINAWETIKQGIDDSEQIRIEAQAQNRIGSENLNKLCAEIRSRFV